jgi:hypothetical protein
MDTDRHTKAAQVMYKPRPAETCRARGMADVCWARITSMLIARALWITAVQTAAPDSSKTLPRMEKMVENMNDTGCFTIPLGQKFNECLQLLYIIDGRGWREQGQCSTYQAKKYQIKCGFRQRSERRRQYNGVFVLWLYCVYIYVGRDRVIWLEFSGDSGIRAGPSGRVNVCAVWIQTETVDSSEAGLHAERCWGVICV